MIIETVSLLLRTTTIDHGETGQVISEFAVNFDIFFSAVCRLFFHFYRDFHIGPMVIGGEEMSAAMTGAVSLAPRHDMPDVVQTPAVTASCYDQDNLCARWLQSNASLDCFSGLCIHCFSELQNKYSSFCTCTTIIP